MADACPIQTPEQRKAAEILHGAKCVMMEKVHAAIAEAEAQVREQTQAAELDLTPPPREYFHVVVHRQMYLAICGANVETFKGGDVRKAIPMIQNQQRIANHYRGADIAVTPKAS